MLAILTSHPIQYQVPLWRALHESNRIPFQVWYLTKHGVEVSKDVDFGETFAWDLDMLGGYSHRFLNVDPDWNLKRFRGIQLREDLGDLMHRERASAVWVEGWRFKAFWDAIWIARRRGLSTWLRGESNDLKQEPTWKRAIKRPSCDNCFVAWIISFASVAPIAGFISPTASPTHDCIRPPTALIMIAFVKLRKRTYRYAINSVAAGTFRRMRFASCFVASLSLKSIRYS
jgi:hypothetical protein